eukprot:TRINITY_DN726_c0_g1_i1.p1 TRINITY_DN726_c0_g1~~TRINITY_DN726_c0_g1_i1.p1  ORF type:complete len:1627 (-),score=400.74 TRINITY_DN726_c0_g1_i1:247-5127(-)
MADSRWKSTSGYGVAVFPFYPTGLHQMGLNVGDEIQINEECAGWYKCLHLPTMSSGIVPASHIKPIEGKGKGKDVVSALQHSSIITFPDPLVNEISRVLREWQIMLKAFFTEKKYAEFKLIKQRMSLLAEWRRILLDQKTPEDVLQKLRQKVLAKIEEGRKIMGLDMIPRTEKGEPADEKNTHLMQLFNMHTDMEGRDAKKSDSKKRDKDRMTSAVNPSLGVHLFMEMKASICSVGEDYELYFTLNRAEGGKLIPVTEPYVISLTALGMPHDVERIGKQKNIFKDLTHKELTTDLYLVVKLIRRGVLKRENETNTSQTVIRSKEEKKNVADFRRPYACGVLKLTPETLKYHAGIVGENANNEHCIPIFQSPQETLFPSLQESIMSEAGNYEPVPRSMGVVVLLQVAVGDFQETIMRRKDFNDLSLSNKLGFPEVIMPGDTRNDLYVTLDHGEFLQDRKKSAKNVEVTARVLNEHGQVVPDAIYIGSGTKPESEYKSVIYYHSNTPQWKDTIRVNIPKEEFERSHLFFTFRHCSSNESKSDREKFFAYAFLKLTEESGTAVLDKSHSLETYKPLPKGEPPIYLRRDAESNKHVVKRGREFLTVRTVLCSTSMTQNGFLLALLKWKSSSQNMRDILNKFTYINQHDIVKFLREIFDALFAILESTNTEDVCTLVFDSMAYMIGFLDDDRPSKFSNFRKVLEAYIETHFRSTVAHEGLMKSILHYLRMMNEPKSASPIRTALKALKFVLKFIVASRLKYDQTKSIQPSNDVDFKKKLQDVFALMNDLMKLQSPELIGAQTTAIKVFAPLFPELSRFLDHEELCQIACNFLGAVHEANKPKLVGEKLHLIQQLLTSDLLSKSESKAMLLRNVIVQLKQHLIKVEELDRSVAILVELLTSCQVSSSGVSVRQLTPLLPAIIKSINTLEQKDVLADKEQKARLPLITGLISLLYLITDAEYIELWMSFSTAEEKKEYTRDLLEVCQSFLLGRTYPEHWLIMCMLQYSVILKVLRLSSESIKTSFLNGDHFDESIWNQYFLLEVAFLNAKALQLESFSTFKQSQLLERYGDLRKEASSLLQQMWNTLGKLQMSFIQVLVNPFLELIRLENESLREVGLNLYFSTIERETEETGNFVLVERCTIDTLDTIANEQNADAFKERFCTRLQAKFQASKSSASKRSESFLNDIRQLLDLMSALRSYPMDLVYEDERTLAILKLMTYLKQTERHESYKKYVHMLRDLHVHNGNFSEAGFTLMLHGELLDWSEETVPAIGEYDSESNASRKERVYLQAIEYFDKGKLWEKAIGLIKELRIQYEDVQYDYHKLSNILNREAQMRTNIADQERFYAEYFRVAYFGRGFPSEYQGKEFVYRGYELEKISEFVQRIQNKFPNAEILQSSAPPSAELANSDGLYIQINTVYPSSVEEMKGQSKPQLKRHMPTRIQKYINSNNVQIFVFSRPFRKTTGKLENEFKDLWISNTYLTVKDAFPTIHRRSEVVERVSVELSPVENAAKSVQSKNKDLEEFVNRFTKPDVDKSQLSSFSMLLNGMIDAAVNGGVNKYRDAFFSQEYASENPDKIVFVTLLKDELRNQVTLLEKGLAAHRIVCPPDMKGLQEKLDTFFAKMKADILRDVSA